MADKYRELEVIQPASMTFVFRMGKGECHKVLTGTCSLDRTVPDRSQDIGDESDYDFCPNLLKSMMDGSYPLRLARKLPIDIVQSTCGHWEFSDGQHRTCIAMRKNLTVEAEVSTDSSGLCELCDDRPEPDDPVEIVYID
jgi:hypothetical protein